MWGGADCLTACLASIFELGIDDVPVRSIDGWLDEAQRWVHELWGLHLETFSASERGQRLSRQTWRPSGYSILITTTGGPGLGGPPHAVVAVDGELAFNPDPRIVLEDPVVEWWGVFLLSRGAFERFLDIESV
jgi:hypothetical protein